MSSTEVRVIGGGFTGTLTAYLLMKKGLKVELHEKSGRWGGLIGTEDSPYGSVEWAANGFLSNRLLEEVAEDIGVRLVPAGERSRARYIFLERLRRWPLGIFETLWTVLRFAISYLSRNAAPAAMESLETWGTRVFGTPFTEKVLRAAVLGIYAAPLEKLSATLIAGRFFGAGRPSTKGRLRGTVAPEGGMGEWISKIIAKLHAGGAELHLNSSPVVEKNPPIPHVICTHMKDLGEIQPENAPFSALRSPGVATCSLFFEEHPDQPRGFGILFHPSQGFSSLGCLFESDNFPRRSRTRAERYILSELYTENLLSLSDQKIIELVLRDRARFSPAQEFLDYRVHRTPQGFPLYGMDLEKILAERRPDDGNVYLHGNFMGRLGLAQIALRPEELVNSLAKLPRQERLHG